jgi:hypothetical protein
MKKDIGKLLAVLLTINCMLLFSQKERGLSVNIPNDNLMQSLDSTHWELKKIMKKNVGLLVLKRKPKEENNMNLFFRNGIVDFYFKSDSTSTTCKYFYLNHNKENFMHFRINCSDTIAYDWTVYRLSERKLVAAIYEVYLQNKSILPKFMGRNIFYRID